MSLSDRWQTELERLRAEDRYRTLTPPAGIDFSSNDYLGYSERLWRAGSASDRSLARSGAASRLLRGHHAIWDEVETKLAAWHGAEAALMMTSGYAANEGLLSTIVQAGDLVFSDRSNHASIIDGLRLARGEKIIYEHADCSHLESLMRQCQPKRSVNQAWFIVTESLFGMDGDVAPLRDLARLAERYDAHLIVDEAHATGCFGDTGSGLVDHEAVRKRVLATVHTGGKALGVPGAYIAGSRLLREMLVNRCRHLIYTTALPPQVGAWWLDALEAVTGDQAARDALMNNARRFHAALGYHSIRSGGDYYIRAVVVGKDARAVEAARRLQEFGFDVRAIRPPTVPVNTARLRISVHADHDETTLRDLAHALAAVLPKAP